MKLKQKAKGAAEVQVAKFKETQDTLVKQFPNY